MNADDNHYDRKVRRLAIHNPVACGAKGNMGQ
jgi:hypothetical protein